MKETAVEKHAFGEIFSLYEISKAEQKNCKDDGDKLNNLLYFEPVLARIDTFLQDPSKDTEDHVKLVAMKSCLYYEQGKLLLEKDQIAFALETMKNALTLIQDHKLNPLITYLYYRIINYHSYYLSRTDNLQEARNILEEAEQLYYALSNKSDIVVCGTDDLFRKGDPKQPFKIEKFERLVTNNLQLQGWIYSKLGDTDKFLVYHHRVLNRHLENQDCDAFTWVNKCSRLATHFIDLRRFSEARYHLAAAYTVLRESEKDVNSTQRSVDIGHVRRAYAELGRQWVKYGLWLFEMSMRKVSVPDEAIDQLLITSFDDTEVIASADEQFGLQAATTDTSEPDVAATDYSETIDNYTFVFPTLFVGDIEAQVTDALFSTTEEARKLFLYVQEWLIRAKAFFTLRQYPTEHVDLIFELCDLYKYLAGYESDMDSQYNVQKRRSDILDTLYGMLKDVQPADYTTCCMEVFRELTQVQIELIFFNLKRLSASSSASRTYIAHQLAAVRSVHEQLGKFVKYQRSKQSARAANNRIVAALSEQAEAHEQIRAAQRERNEQGATEKKEQFATEANEQIGPETSEQIGPEVNEQAVIEDNEQAVIEDNEQAVIEDNEQIRNNENSATSEHAADAVEEQIVNAAEPAADVIDEQPVAATAEETVVQ